ncbi:MAG TPA: 3-deoxy-manno-octulosonate cytidylyltransferase [Acidobacteriaceae bacterium]|nr:3-deoxy-manno-octulosonate cytidylyltransferase [Acidobacteriaceae bacterium]
MTRILGVVPARLASTRLPRKVLREIAGEPLLVWVVRAANACPQLDEVVVATDAAEVENLCRARGWRCVMTDPALPSGTDRLHAVSRSLPADIYVNIQGDEPLLQPGHIEAILRPFRHPHVDVSTLKVPCSQANLQNPNVVKVVTARDGRALYFSRSAIPFVRDHGTPAQHWKHLGLYAYRKAALERFAGLPVGELEVIERLEQLRLLEHGLSLYVEAVEEDTVGVDTEQDLAEVEQILLASKEAQR